MNEFQRLVRDFHEATGSTVGETPEIRDNELRAKLILEEAAETAAALGFDVDVWMGTPPDGTMFNINKDAAPSEIEVIDGLCDLLYVTFGAAVAAGIDLDPFFHEVHATNMAKLAGERRADGKVLKPEGWRPPKIAELLQQLRDRVVLPNVHLTEEALDTQV